LANAKITTDTQGLLGREDVMTDETDESSASGCARRLLLSQSPFSPVAPLSSFEAVMTCGAVEPEEAETPLSALGPKFQGQRTQSTEAPFMSPAWMHMFLRTASQSCFFQDLLLAACHYCDHFPRKQLTEFDATFTFNADGYPIFDQNNWATYRAAMKEDKPPPGSSTKELRLSTEAAYLARKTLVLKEKPPPEPPPDSEGHANTQMIPGKGAAYFAREGKPPPEPPPDSEGHANPQMSPSKGAAYFARQRSLWAGRKFCSAQLCEKFRGTTSTTFPPSSSSGYRCVVVLAS
jgi:hypothetical protein